MLAKLYIVNNSITTFQKYYWLVPKNRSQFLWLKIANISKLTFHYLHLYSENKIWESRKAVALRKLGNWTKVVSNHFHHCAEETDCGSTKREETWLSVLRHTVDEHEHPENQHHKRCNHEEIKDKSDDRKRCVPDWLFKGW